MTKQLRLSQIWVTKLPYGFNGLQTPHCLVSSFSSLAQSAFWLWRTILCIVGMFSNVPGLHPWDACSTAQLWCCQMSPGAKTTPSWEPLNQREVGWETRQQNNLQHFLPAYNHNNSTLLECLLFLEAVPLIYLILSSILQSNYYHYLHFTHQKTDLS